MVLDERHRIMITPFDPASVTAMSKPRSRPG
jgi:hypothetical protein